MGPTLDRAPRWEHFEHEADIGIRGIGPTRAAAFEQAALALTAVITEPDRIARTAAVPIDCDAPTDDLLLVEWINAIVYEMATRHMIFGGYDVRIEGSRLTARAVGERVDVARHEPAVEVKAATYGELGVTCAPDGSWVAQCVVDV